MATSGTYQGYVNGISHYVGTGHSDTIRKSGTSFLFTLQGDDVLSSRVYSANSVPWLIGGSGNDTYKNTAMMFIADAGGGNDTLEFPSMSYTEFLVTTLYTVTVDNRHVVISNGFTGVYVFDYQTEASRIENVKFSDGSVISFDAMLNYIAGNGGHSGNVTMTELLSVNGPVSSAAVENIQSLINNYQTYNAQYEAAADFSRAAETADAQKIARLYQAAFDRTPDVDGLNNWIDHWENNMTDSQIASAFTSSAEFDLLYGTNVSNSDYVTALYRNALDREPDTAGHAGWVGQLDGGHLSREQVLIHFSESEENKEKTAPTFESMRASNGNWTFDQVASRELIDSVISEQGLDEITLLSDVALGLDQLLLV